MTDHKVCDLNSKTYLAVLARDCYWCEKGHFPYKQCCLACGKNGSEPHFALSPGHILILQTLSCHSIPQVTATGLDTVAYNVLGRLALR